MLNLKRRIKKKMRLIMINLFEIIDNNPSLNIIKFIIYISNYY